jgi:5'-3' exonuclease
MIYNPISKKVTNEKSFMEKTGIHPNQWNVYRALVGGKDNVPGVEGIGAVTATKYIQGKLKDCLAIKTIAKNAEKLQSIIELVTLPINHPSLTTSWLKNVPRRDTANREKWEMFCDKMRLREIRRKRLEGNNG